MIYFDNAATSFPKPKCVVDELYRCVCKYCGNPGRSSHIMSRMSEEAIFKARESVAELFSVSEPEKIVFTYNATYALNLAIKTLIARKMHVLTSDIEHNSVIRPLETLKKTLGLEYSSFSTDSDLQASLFASVKENTGAIVSTLQSNVTGVRVNIDVLSDFARRRGLILILDASQAAGHLAIDLSNKYYSALCAPAHKGLYGIQGCGFAVFSSNKRLGSFIEGGSGTDSASRDMPDLLPEGYEAGTLATPAIVTLAAGIDFIKSIGVDRIGERLDYLTNVLVQQLRYIDGIVVYPSNSGIISFNAKNVSSVQLASALDKHGICTRAGLHCAPSAHYKLGTQRIGTVRASLSYFNTEDEIRVLCDAIKKELGKV